MKMEACWVAGRMTDQNEEEKREKLVALDGPRLYERISRH